ncbi:MAG: sulfatase-like hydrolase/transferase, partial [Candidatus Omnitrophica bacterium]|nr:sulfatase-like hydrolase/transferase [Candidatus Omnitrophota bacterium]
GEITGMDRAFGKLRDSLREQGIAEDTILWYCSDNGGLPEVGSTGGRGHKADIYEGGLRVPAILEWPSHIPEPRVTSLPCNTCDFFPTLLDIAGIHLDPQPPLDGVSLVPLISGGMEKRGQGMGFWEYPAKGISTPSKEIMAELYEAQKEGKRTTRPELLRLNADKIEKQYPTDTFPGHAAWLEWPLKLHRIELKEGEVVFELYDLEADPMEKNDLLSEQEGESAGLKQRLNDWQVSVVNSLNGDDY